MSYLDEIRARYDIRDHVEAPVAIPDLPTEGIVLIVGTSGSGKSTILRSLPNAKSAIHSHKSEVIINCSTPER